MCMGALIRSSFIQKFKHANVLLLHILGRVSGKVLLMKVGFHVYLMLWFAELCSNVNSNEDWHVENRLRHSPRPQVHTVRLDSCPISLLLPQHLSVQTDNITVITSYLLNVVCVGLCFSLHPFSST